MILVCARSLGLVPRPSRSHANIIREIFYMHQKAGRSGRFYAVMMMSPGRGLARPGRGSIQNTTCPRALYWPKASQSARSVCAMPHPINSTSRALKWAGVDAGLRSNLFSLGRLSCQVNNFDEFEYISPLGGLQHLLETSAR